MELPEGLIEKIKDKDKAFLDPRGATLTKSLFHEHLYDQKYLKHNYEPLYTFREYDHHGCYSLKKLYLEMMDPTEYKVASQLFYSWKHWQRLCKLDWFIEHVTEWRAELDIKLTSEACSAIAEQAALGGKESIPAAKYLAERGWEKKSGRGRPSKAEVDGERKKQAGLRKVVDNDAERIGIKREPTKRD